MISASLTLHDKGNSFVSLPFRNVLSINADGEVGLEHYLLKIRLSQPLTRGLFFTSSG